MTITYKVSGSRRDELEGAVNEVVATYDMYKDFKYNIDNKGVLTGEYSSFLKEILEVEYGFVAVSFDPGY